MANRPRSGPPTPMPSAGRSCWRGRDHARRCGDYSRAWNSSRWRPPALQVSPGNETHLHAFGTEWSRPAGATGATCAPRRNSPARSCWRPASGASSSSRACSATASAGRCTIPNSPCSNGIARTALRDADGRLHGGRWRARRRPPAPGSSPGASRIADPSPSRSASRWPRLSSAMPGSTCWRRCRRTGPTAAGSRAWRATPACNIAERRHLGRHLQPGAGGEDRAQSRHRPGRPSSTNIRP